MTLSDIFAKLTGKTEQPPAFKPTVYDDPQFFIQQPQRKEISPVMSAIRASQLEVATVLMQAGSPVDFTDPAIETQMRVATYEADFEFLSALETRRKIQDAAEKEIVRVAQVTTAQEAKGAELQKLAGIAMAISDGADNPVKAPKTASFRKKNGPLA